MHRLYAELEIFLATASRLAGSKGTSHQIDSRNIGTNTFDVTVSAVPIIQDSVNTLPLLFEHTHDVSVKKFFGPFQEIKKILVNARNSLFEVGRRCVASRNSRYNPASRSG